MDQSDWASAFADAYWSLCDERASLETLNDWGLLLWKQNHGKEPSAVAALKYYELEHATRYRGLAENRLVPR